MGLPKEDIKKNLDVAYTMLDENGNEVFKSRVKLAEIPEEDKQYITSLVIFPLRLKTGKYAATLYTLDADYIRDFPLLKKLAVTPQFKTHNIPAIQEANCGSLYDVYRYVPSGYEDLSPINFKSSRRLIAHQNATEMGVSDYNKSLRLTGNGQEEVALIELGKDGKFRIIDTYTYKQPRLKEDIIVDDNGARHNDEDSKIDDTVKLLDGKIEELNEETENIDGDKKELYTRLLRGLMSRLDDKQKSKIGTALERINPNIADEAKKTIIGETFARFPALISGATTKRETHVRNLVHFLSGQENSEENIEKISGQIEEYLIKILLSDPSLFVSYKLNQVIDGDDLVAKINQSVLNLWKEIEEYFRISQRQDQDKVKAILSAYAKNQGSTLVSNVVDRIVSKESKINRILQLTEGSENPQEDEDALGLISGGNEGSEDEKDNGGDSETRRKFAERLAITIVNTFNTNIYNISDETLDRVERIVSNAVKNLGLDNINATLKAIKDELSNIITREDVEGIVRESVAKIMGENKQKEQEGKSIADLYSKIDDIYKLLQENNLSRQQTEDLFNSRWGSMITKIIAALENNTSVTNNTNNILELLNKTVNKNSTVINQNSTVIENNSTAITKLQNLINKHESNTTTAVDQLALIIKQLVKQQKSGDTNINIDIDSITKIANLIQQYNLTDNTFNVQNIYKTIIQNYLTTSIMASSMFNNQMQLGGFGMVNPLMIGMQNTNAISNILMMSILGLGVNNNILNLIGGGQTKDPNQDKIMELLLKILKLLEDGKEKKDPIQEIEHPVKPVKPVKPSKPVKVVKPKKTKEIKYKEKTIKDLHKLREPKRKENLFQKIARHPIKTALTVAGIGAAIGLGAYAILPGTIANVVAGVPLLSKVANLAMGAVMPVGIGAGAGLVAGGVLGGVSSAFKGFRRERLYKKFQKKYNKAINSASVVQLAQDKVNAKKAEKEALRENLRAAKTERQRNKALKALAKKRKQITKAKNKEAKVSKKFTTKVQKALDTKEKLNNLEDVTGKTTAMGGAVQYVRNKQHKLDNEELEDVTESINEELSDLTGEKVEIENFNPRHKTYDAEAVDLISMVDKLKKSNEFNHTLSEIEVRHKGEVEEEKVVQQYDIADIEKMILEANANPSKENEALVNEVIAEYNAIQRQLRAKGRDAKEIPPYVMPAIPVEDVSTLLDNIVENNTNDHTK